MLYMNCVCVLKACFRKVNENLEQIDKSLTKDIDYTETQWVEKSPRDVQRNTMLLMKVKSLEEKHLRLSDVVQLLNKTFLIHIITLSILTFVNVTFNLYYYILWINNGLPSDLAKQIWYFQFLTSVFYFMIKFMMSIWACETAKNQALAIGITVHNALSNANDTLVQHELTLFSLQILQQDNTFSARVVTMNAALLMQIMGGVVMYLLILFQFLLNAIACKDPD
ncbi:uncharacterized protein LOC122401676 [Colletes gigas]|uniref:uncharacterized protein LOC122401676 n=1 Tax=Colletes gigas TaxID=935657 RepID=UPI001C9B58AF|nr:uncharacterized protein LOC122401676 [Colletes gigas]